MTKNAVSDSFTPPTLNDVLHYADRLKKPCGVIVIAVDHMASQQGHIEHLTSQLYMPLRQHSRITDTLIRFSDDCWLICLDDCNDHLLKWTLCCIQRVLNQLSAQLNSPLGHALVSAGSILLQQRSFKRSLKMIEQEIQTVKSQLRRLKMIRLTVLGDTAFSPKTQNDLTIQAQRAILDNRLFLAFQPILSNESGQIKYYECLARILDEGGQILPAGDFIPPCEKDGLIPFIDQRIQQLAIEELMNNRHINLAINVSAITAADSIWLNTLKSHMAARPDIADRLIIELTETSVFHDTEESIAFITQLRNLGCRVSIDDFGAGYMALMHLKFGLVQIVKIDAQYIKNLATEPDNLHFIRAVLALTQSQDIECVAEGVENAETISILAQENIQYLQGYYLGKPSPFRQWI
jgi:EAL domain-containing protein (putative c-di-GMP-specific phosphodiesterase class I)